MGNNDATSGNGCFYSCLSLGGRGSQLCALRPGGEPSPALNFRAISYGFVSLTASTNAVHSLADARRCGVSSAELPTPQRSTCSPLGALTPGGPLARYTGERHFVRLEHN